MQRHQSDSATVISAASEELFWGGDPSLKVSLQCPWKPILMFSTPLSRTVSEQGFFQHVSDFLNIFHNILLSFFSSCSVETSCLLLVISIEVF
jgi:hypothetical protein